MTVLSEHTCGDNQDLKRLVEHPAADRLCQRLLIAVNGGHDERHIGGFELVVGLRRLHTIQEPADHTEHPHAPPPDACTPALCCVATPDQRCQHHVSATCKEHRYSGSGRHGGGEMAAGRDVQILWVGHRKAMALEHVLQVGSEIGAQVVVKEAPPRVPALPLACRRNSCIAGRPVGGVCSQAARSAQPGGSEADFKQAHAQESHAVGRVCRCAPTSPRGSRAGRAALMASETGSR